MGQDGTRFFRLLNRPVLFRKQETPQVSRRGTWGGQTGLGRSKGTTSWWLLCSQWDRRERIRSAQLWWSSGRIFRGWSSSTGGLGSDVLHMPHMQAPTPAMDTLCFATTDTLCFAMPHMQGSCTGTARAVGAGTCLAIRTPCGPNTARPVGLLRSARLPHRKGVLG
jgi:hypothetical protein